MSIYIYVCVEGASVREYSHYVLTYICDFCILVTFWSVELGFFSVGFYFSMEFFSLIGSLVDWYYSKISVATFIKMFSQDKFFYNPITEYYFYVEKLYYSVLGESYINLFAVCVWKTTFLEL